jgi:hypothetical protein
MSAFPVREASPRLELFQPIFGSLERPPNALFKGIVVKLGRLFVRLRTQSISMGVTFLVGAVFGSSAVREAVPCRIEEASLLS